MIFFESLLYNVAKDVGIDVPDDYNAYDPDLFPNYVVYIGVQMGALIPYENSHIDNAAIIRDIPLDVIRHVTRTELVDEYGVVLEF